MATRLVDLSQPSEASQISPPGGRPKGQNASSIKLPFLYVWKPNKSDSRHVGTFGKRLIMSHLTRADSQL